jgi:hypothetical protein
LRHNIPGGSFFFERKPGGSVRTWKEVDAHSPVIQQTKKYTEALGRYDSSPRRRGALEFLRRFLFIAH